MTHDYLSDRMANFKLMSDIKNWWRKRGYIVRVWLEKSADPNGGITIYTIRTNIPQSIATAQAGNFID